jgi:hypothetical protein
MDDQIRLKNRSAANELEISKLKERLQVLELEQHKIGIALEMIGSLTPDDGQSFPTEPGSRRRRFAEPAQDSPPLSAKGIKLSVRQLVLQELENFGSPLTKMDVVSRLTGAGHNVNSVTIGTTLSKLVEAGHVEKASHSAYRIKVEVPNSDIVTQ